MKNIALKLSLLVATCVYSCSAGGQTIIAYGDENVTLPVNAMSTGQYYFKDVDQHLDNFVGTWQYVNSSEKFEVVCTKITNYHNVDPALNLNIYQDGITTQYRKYVNNVLVYQSPSQTVPELFSRDGVVLAGHTVDYGRTTKTIYFPHDPTMVLQEGGGFIHPRTRLEIVNDNPQQIKFSLSLTGTINYDVETYQGQPIFSIPNDVIMTKVN